ncbi:hypothetical protein VPH35_116967 [Triticum aestivum]
MAARPYRPSASLHGAAASASLCRAAASSSSSGLAFLSRAATQDAPLLSSFPASTTCMPPPRRSPRPPAGAYCRPSPWLEKPEPPSAPLASSRPAPASTSTHGRLLLLVDASRACSNSTAGPHACPACSPSTCTSGCFPLHQRPVDSLTVRQDHLSSTTRNFKSEDCRGRVSRLLPLRFVYTASSLNDPDVSAHEHFGFARPVHGSSNNAPAVRQVRLLHRYAKYLDPCTTIIAPKTLDSLSTSPKRTCTATFTTFA